MFFYIEKSEKFKVLDGKRMIKNPVTRLREKSQSYYSNN